MGNNQQLHKVEEIISWEETGDVTPNLVEFLEETSLRMTGKVFILVHKHHEVLIGEIRDGKIAVKNPEQLTPEYLQEIRMFTRSGELYIWNCGGQLKYRLRLDEQGDRTHRYDEDHFMWGQKKDNDNTVTEPNRGMRLSFPFPFTEEDCPLKYRVRNYLEFDDHGQLRFYDARLITFLNKEGKEMLS